MPNTLPATPRTVGDVRRYGLPLGTRILSGGDQLGRAVRWALTVSVTASLPYLEGDELFLVLPGKLSEDWVQQVTDAGIAGLVVTEPLDSLPLAAAQLNGLPVLQLPSGSRLREVERSVIEVLIRHSEQIERQSIEIYQQLVRLVTDYKDLRTILDQLSLLIDKAVVVQDKRFKIQEIAIPPRLSQQFPEIETKITQRGTIPEQFLDRHKLPMSTKPTHLQPLKDTPYARLITPIITQNVGRGFLSFIAPMESFSELDRYVVQHSAVICAIEMARAKAISEVEKRLRGDFIGALISGSLHGDEATIEGGRFGHDVDQPHIAIVVRWQNKPHPSLRSLETLVNGLVIRYPNRILSQLFEQEIRIFFSVDENDPIQEARTLAKELQEEALLEHRNAPLVIGISTRAKQVKEWRVIYQEAKQACEFAQRLSSKEPLYISDLGIFKFLSRENFHDDLMQLRHDTIGMLIENEDRQNVDLLLTLEAFFQTHGNNTQTADLLNIHRNTLSYRMDRIKALTGLDLDQPDVRLAVHLAIRIHRLIGNSSNTGNRKG
jgi:purine catabolism regulator